MVLQLARGGGGGGGGVPGGGGGGGLLKKWLKSTRIILPYLFKSLP